jgi:poly(A) polymerase
MSETKFPDGAHPVDNEINRRIVAAASRTGQKVYLVGGYIRDTLLSKQKGIKWSASNAKDLDYAVKGGTAFELAKSVAAEFKGHYVPLDKEHDTARVVLEDMTILDFAGCVGGKIEEDVLGRDFTINALVWDPENPDEVLDVVGGIKDLEQLTLRAISESVLIEDPLRLLRAFRFCATIGGAIEPQTRQWIEKNAQFLSSVPKERINTELFATLAVTDTGSILAELAQSRLLEVIFPELEATRQVPPNTFHHLGLFEHSLEAVSQIERKFSSLPDWVQQQMQDDLSAGVSRLAATKVATLLHDIGKPKTWTITEDGRHAFYGHDKLGADMAALIAERMKWSIAVERFVVKLIRWHLRPGQLFIQGPPTERALLRFYRLVGDDFPALMLLALGDFGATCGPALVGEKREEFERQLFELFQGYNVFKEEREKSVPLLDGNDVMKLLGLKPGKHVGDILRALDEAQLIKEVLNRSDAERFVLQLHSQKYCK